MKQKQAGDSIINKLHRLGFPNVSKVRDANEPIYVTVTKQDSKVGRKKTPTDCALARACVRKENADGAVINIGTSYVIKGKVATRYTTSVAVGREIVSFDRNGGFEPGHDYLLAAPCATQRLDAPRRGSGYVQGAGKPKTGRPVIHRHHTENICVSRALPKKK